MMMDTTIPPMAPLTLVMPSNDYDDDDDDDDDSEYHPDDDSDDDNSYSAHDSDDAGAFPGVDADPPTVATTGTTGVKTEEEQQINANDVGD